ncbi:MAG: alanine racemase [Proteobacteria bacterium]|nr:alanine racemase [Pseudomonadota bacterium]MDA1299453.1 alanine racemase [Pseudomonadota bacterium]
MAADSVAVQATIDCSALSFNLGVVKRLAPASKVMCVIKADGYGHGAVASAQALPDADAFGVARIEEAAQLRECGITAPVTVLEGPMDESQLRRIQGLGADIVLHSPHQLDLLDRVPFDHGVWLKVTTGMNRLGFNASGLALSGLLDRLGRSRLLGVMTHLASADDDHGTTADLINQFRTALSGYDVPLSVANSAAILAFPQAHLDWVRPGIMLYGVSPFADRNHGLRPAMTLTASVIAINDLNAGDSVGYHGIWTAERRCRVAVLAAGYADGYPREVSQEAQVWLGGCRCRVVGRVSMDMICVLLADGQQVRIGDQAELWGTRIPIHEVAARSGTIPYTLLSHIGKRVSRRPVYGAQHGEK